MGRTAHTPAYAHIDSLEQQLKAKEEEIDRLREIVQIERTSANEAIGALEKIISIAKKAR